MANYNSELRDNATGRLVKDHTPAAREYYLLRHPNIDPATLPPVEQRSDHRQVNGFVNGRRCVTADDVGLLQDPVWYVRKSSPTKPVAPTRRHASERAIAVAWHEAFHAGAGLYYGLRVSSSTILPDNAGDGCTMVQDVKSVAPTLHGLVMLAGQEGDAIGGFRMSSENYATDDADIGGSLEWREGLRQQVRSDLPKFIGGVNEIARQLLAKETLSEFQIKSAFIRGQRRAREVEEKVAPTKGRVIREFDFSKQEDVRAWNRQQGHEDLDREPIGFGVGHIVAESYR